MKLSSLSLVKYALAAVLTLLFGTAYSQYPATGNKQRLGWQTTGDGLVYRGAIADTSTLDPSGLNNAWMLLDTASGNLYAYRIKAWRLVSGGGGGGGASMPFDSVTFNINEGDASEQELKYSADKGYLQYGGLDSVQIPLLPGIWYVRNDTSVTIPKGTVVRASGTLGASGRIKVKHMIANGSIPAMYVLGIAMQDIATGADGYVMTQGKIRQVNTQAYSEGAVLYADVDTLGGLTQTKPGNGYLKLPIAFVVRSASNGTLAVRIDAGSSLHDLHDVDTTGRVNGSVLRYDSALKYWKASTTAGILASDTSTFVRQYQLSGNTGYLPRYTSDTTMGNSVVYQHSGNIGINSTTATNNKFQIGDVGTTGYAGNDLAIGNGTGVMAIEQTSTLTKIVTNKDFSFMPAGVGATGRVGIGTTSPARTLHVEGEARITDLTTDTPTQIIGADADGDLGAVTLGTGLSIASGTLSTSAILPADTSVFARDWQIVGTELYIPKFNVNGTSIGNSIIYETTTGNNIGIGTTSPATLAGNGITLGSSTTGRSLYLRTSSEGNNGVIHYFDVNGSNAFQMGAVSSSIFLYGYGARPMRFLTNEAERMRITDAGRVGIGTTSPSRSLHISATDAVRIPAGTNAQQTGGDAGDLRLNTDDSNLRFYDNTGWRAVMQSSNTVGRGTAGRVFYADADGRVAGDEPLYWDATNNRLGVNQATPIAPLDVNGGARITTVLEVPNIRNGTTANNVLTLAGNAAASGNTATSENIAFNVGNNGATRAMTILNNGRVGIGKSPTAKFHIDASTGGANSGINFELTQQNANGALRYSGFDYNSYNVVSGTVTGTKLIGQMFLTAPDYTSSLLDSSSLALFAYEHNVELYAKNKVKLKTGSIFGPTTIGEFSDTETRLGGVNTTATYIPAGKMYVGGTTSPGATLHVNGSLSRNAPVTVTGATYSIGDTDSWIICNRTGTITLTLPTASSWTGREIMVKTITANTVISNATNISPLDGGTNTTAILPATDGAWATLVSDGTNWIIMQRGS